MTISTDTCDCAVSCLHCAKNRRLLDALALAARAILKEVEIWDLRNAQNEGTWAFDPDGADGMLIEALADYEAEKTDLSHA